MAEYISREKAIKELREVYEQEYPTASGDFDEYASHDMPNVLRNIPAADAQPVKHGRWIHDRRTQWKCSECGNFLDFDGLNCGRGSAFYCPNCGAIMDGE